MIIIIKKLFLSVTLAASLVLLLMNCAQDANSPAGEDGGAPPSFTATKTNRGNSFQVSPSTGSNTNSDNPLFKDATVTDNEKRWGTSAPINEYKTSVFRDYRMGLPINDPDEINNLRVYVDLSKTIDAKTYGGSVTIAYEDFSDLETPGRYVQFESGTGQDSQYNIWFKKTGSSKLYYHGFFQDTDGSLILVIDEKTKMVRNSDKPSTTNLYDGSVWIMMFRTTFVNKTSCTNQDNRYVAHHNEWASSNGAEPLSFPRAKCWFINIGPFDCKTWRTKTGGINTVAAVEPDGDCYKKLGDFIGLDVLEAFDITSISQIKLN